MRQDQLHAFVGAQRGELWSFRPQLIGDMAQHCTRHSAIALKRSRFAGTGRRAVPANAEEASSPIRNASADHMSNRNRNADPNNDGHIADPNDDGTTTRYEDFRKLVNIHSTNTAPPPGGQRKRHQSIKQPALRG